MSYGRTGKIKMTTNPMTVIGDTSVLVSAAKYSLEHFYSNDEATLESKWHVFTMAPDYLKNHGDYYNHGIKYLDGSDIELEQFYHLDRYRTYSMGEIIESMQDAANDPEAYELDRVVTQEDINFVKEQILSLNLGSFTNDW